MSDLATESLTIVVAMTERVSVAFADRLARFAEEAGEQGEVYVVDASGSLTAELLAGRYANVHILYRPIGQLAPQLWRDGLIRSEAPLIAFTTAQMSVCRGWRNALVERLRETDASGVGGPIEPSPSLSRTDCAVALLRYSSYFPPLRPKDLSNPPGDNALYRRDRLREIERTWANGFWEVEVHQALRDRGQSLAMADRAVATFEGGNRLFAMAWQRARHAKRYGAARSRRSNPFVRFVRVAMSPLVPALLCARIAWRVRGRRRQMTTFVIALPHLLILASAWAFGEAIGIWSTRKILPDASR